MLTLFFPPWLLFHPVVVFTCRPRNRKQVFQSICFVNTGIQQHTVHLSGTPDDMPSKRIVVLAATKYGREASRAWAKHGEAAFAAQSEVDWKPGDATVVNPVRASDQGGSGAQQRGSTTPPIHSCQVARYQQPDQPVQILNSADSMQGGRARHSHTWYIRFESNSKYVSPLMGWTGTTDTIQQLPPHGMITNNGVLKKMVYQRIANGVVYKTHNPQRTLNTKTHTLPALSKFASKEDAIEYCVKHGWEYAVHESVAATGMDMTTPAARPQQYKTYGDTFSVRRHGLPVGGLPSMEKNAGEQEEADEKQDAGEKKKGEQKEQGCACCSQRA